MKKIPLIFKNPVSVFIFCLSVFIFNCTAVQANSWLTVEGVDSDSMPSSINRGTYTELLKFKIIAGNEDIKISNIRLYGENQDGDILTKADIGNGSLYDENGKQVSYGSLYNGYWSFIYMTLEIPAGQSKTLTFKSSMSELTEIEKFRIIANEKYISAIKIVTDEKVSWNDTSEIRDEDLIQTDVASDWMILNASTKPRIPDLYVMRAYSRPASPYLSDLICYDASVKNFGLADLSGEEIFVDLFINEKSIGKVSFGSNLEMDKEVSRKLFCSDVLEDGILHVGNNTIELVLDPDNSIAELDEDNNKRTFNMNIIDGGATLPDLVPSDLECHIANASAGEFVVCNYHIKNDGSAGLTGKFKVMANNGSDEWFATPQPGKWINSTISADLPSDGKITLTIDPYNQIHEENEDNNTLEYILSGYENTQEDDEDSEDDSKEGEIDEGYLVRANGDSKVYLIKGDHKYWIRTAQDFSADGFNWKDVSVVSANALHLYTESVYIPQGKVIIRATGESKVYRVIGGKRLWIPSVETFNKQGLSWSGVSEITADSMSDYPDLKLVKDEDSESIYYITNSGMKKLILNDKVFLSYGSKYEDVVSVSSDILDSFEDVTLIKDSNNKVYKIEAGKKKWIKTAQAFNKYGFNWGKIAPVNEVEINAYIDDGIIE